jgi:hypothetical protein
LHADGFLFDLVGSSSKVLIYGGTKIANLQGKIQVPLIGPALLTQSHTIGLPLLDYAFTYDLDTHTYKKVNFTNTAGGAGPRIGHSGICTTDEGT